MCICVWECLCVYVSISDELHLLLHVHYTLICRIIREYIAFKTRSLAEPGDSKEMMEMVAYMTEAKTTLLSSLEQDVQSSLKRLSYLLDVYDFSPTDMELNQTTLMWPKKLDPIFEQNEQVTLVSSLYHW